ncbi:MAG TPA: alpha/beta fold hydrolase [Gemmatimonadales bacterium]|nr:alpha/beta fold hydrolase [Gemmatimonadales bacterium]
MPIDLRIYPDDCDAFGHLNQAAFVRLFERARWDTLADGPGMDAFEQAGAWPAVRRTSVEYLAAAFPGDVVRFEQLVTHVGRTSFTMRQTARRLGDDRLLAAAEFVFVSVDREGRPMAVPEVVRELFGGGPGKDGVRLTVHGVELAVSVEGEGPAVVFLHGYPLDRTIWAHQVANLPGFRRIAPDLRGFGRSDAPDLGYSMETWADDVAALLDALGEERAVLTGHSMGGYVAFEFARRHRDRLAGLILVDTRAGADSEEARRGRDAAIQLVRERGAGPIAEQMLPKLFAPGSPARRPEAVAQVEAVMRRTPVAGIAGALAAMRDRADSRPLLPTLDVPALVLVGAEDGITPPAEAEAMAAALPGAMLREIPEAGHMASLEQPEVVTAAIAEFLGGIGGV